MKKKAIVFDLTLSELAALLSERKDEYGHNPFREAASAIDCDGAIVDGEDVSDPDMVVGTVTVNVKSVVLTAVQPITQVL
jgi:hypothetical protein